MIPMMTVEHHDVVQQNPVLRQRVDQLQVSMAVMEQVELDTVHTFHGGVYCRQLLHPRDVVLVGKVHKKDHMFQLISGIIVVTMGDHVQEMEGPCPPIPCAPGVKRAIYAVTDAVYMTIHRTEALTPEDAENELVEHDPLSKYDAQNKVIVPQIERVA
jgi:hypothetical protein